LVSKTGEEAFFSAQHKYVCVHTWAYSHQVFVSWSTCLVLTFPYLLLG